MRRARTCPWIRIRPYRVLLRGQGVFFAAQSSADCITNTSGFDLRQAQGTARRKGGSGNRGRPVKGESSGLNVAKGGGHGGSRTGSYDRRSRVMLAEERALTSGALSKM